MPELFVFVFRRIKWYVKSRNKIDAINYYVTTSFQATTTSICYNFFDDVSRHKEIKLESMEYFMNILSTYELFMLHNKSLYKSYASSRIIIMLSRVFGE